MIKAFKIYVALTVAGFTSRLIWDLNHAFKWIEDGDIFYGAGIGAIMLAWAIEIDSHQSHGWKKVFTRFGLFTAIANICDEAFFDPQRTSWQEWVAALGVLVFLYIRNQKVKRNELV